MSEKNGQKRGRPARSKEEKLRLFCLKEGISYPFPEIRERMTDCIKTEKINHGFEPPFTLDWQTVANNERYMIRDALINDKRGQPVLTLSLTLLNKRSETRGHFHKESAEIYIFLPEPMKSSRGVMHVGKREMTVTGADYDTVFVDKGEFHKVINPNHFVKLPFLTISPNHVRRPPFDNGEAFTEQKTVKREYWKAEFAGDRKPLFS